MTVRVRDGLRASAATAAALLALAGAFVAPAGAQDGEAPTGAQNEIEAGDAGQETPAGTGASQTQPLFTETDTGPDDASGDGGGIPLVLASSLVGQAVFNLNGVDEVGRVSDIAVGADGTFAAFVLSAGDREIAVERGEIGWAEFEPGRRVLAMNAAAGRLDSFPDFDREGVIAESGGLNGTLGGQTPETAGAPVDGQPAQNAAGATQQDGATGEQAATTPEAGDAQRQAQADGQPKQDATEATAQIGDEVPGAAEPAEGQSADRHLLRGPDGTNDGIRPHGAPAQTLDGFSITGNNQPQQIQGDDALGDQAAGEALDPPQPPLTTDNLQGLRVFGPEEEEIGSVTGVILTPEGEVEAVVVETGGFLGLGSHSIAVDFARFDFVQQAGMRAVQLDVTEEQMRDHPSYDADAYRDGEESPILR